MSAKKPYPQNQTESNPVSKPKTKNSKKSRASWLFIGLGLTTVALLSAGAGAILAVALSASPLRQSKLTPEQAAVFNQEGTIAYKNLRLPELSRPVNILILGTKVLTSDVNDASNQEVQKNLGYQALVNSFQGLTDVMLLVRFDPAKGTFTLLSIPRDTKATIEGHGQRKINEANNYGGPALTAQTVSNLLDGVPIDRYVVVNVQGVEKLIDALGGVNVYVPKDMKYNDDSQHLYINLKEGQQHLDGSKAVQFLRFRYDEYGDIGRVQRQQMLLRSLVEQSLNPQVLLKVPDILKVIQSHIDTNLTVEELVALSGFAAQTKRANMQMVMLPGAFSGNGRKGVSYWLPNSEQIQKLVAQHFSQGEVGSETIEPTSLRIAIQNGTNNPEAAQKMVRYLREAGYNRVYLSEGWKEPLKTTRIVAQKGDDSGASDLRAKLGVGEILVESTGNLSSDVTIQLGEDWQPQ